MQNTQVVNSKPLACVGCPYYDRPGPVYGSGHPEATVAFVGIAPASEELSKGEPFSGGSGRILDRGCHAAGLSRKTHFTTNVVKCFVAPGERLNPKAVDHCRWLLDQELLGLRKLRVIATLGEAPFKAFTARNLTSVMDRHDSTKWLRGCVWPYNSTTVLIPLMHPQFYARTGFVTSYQFECDLQKVAKFANGRGNRYANRSANYNPTNREVEELVQRIRRLGYGGIDIETPEDADEDELTASGKYLPIDVIGISPEIGVAVGIRPDQFQLVKPLFTDPAHPVRWYVFNASFDFYHIGNHFGALYGVRFFDVMLGLNRWRSDLIKKDLGMAMSFFTHMPYTKNLAKVDPITYQWADTTGVLEAGLTMEGVLEVQGLLKRVLTGDHPLIEDLVNPTRDGLTQMRVKGIRTDLTEVFKFLKISQEMVAKYETVWKKAFPLVDWSSPKQLGELFVGVFKLPVIMRRRAKKKDGQYVITKTPACDVAALEEYRDKYQNKAATLVLGMRTFKHLGDFASIIRPDTNRIHAAYMIHRQVQFRLQAKEPNIQTLPEEIAGYETRQMILPDNPETDLLIAVDGSQCELRIYAWLAKATNLLSAMARGEYIYGYMYEQIFGKSFFNPTGPRTKYNKAPYVTPQEILAAKSGPLGFIYNRGPESLIHDHRIHMEKEIAYQCHRGFHSENPEIGEFHSATDKSVAKLGYQDNLWGGRRYFPTPRIQRNEYLSFHGQSNWAELLRDNYLIPAFTNLPDFVGSRVLLTVHDSMLTNVAGGRENPQRMVAVAQMLYDACEAPIPQMDGFVIPAEVKWGPRWNGKMKLFNTHKDANGRTIVDSL